MAKDSPTTNNSSALSQELNELRSRLEWFEEERRKTNRRLVEVEQRLSTQDRTLQSREQRISQLEEQLTKATAQLSRITQVDAQLRQFKDEMVQLIEQYDHRRILSAEELERLNRVQQEVTARELAEIRKELPPIPRLQKDMELRQAEEARLANLIGVLQNRLAALDGRVENWSNDLAFLEETGKQNQRYISDMQTSLLEISKRWEPINNRLDIVANNLNKAENRLNSLDDIHTDLRQIIKQWTEQIQIGEYERNQRLEEWQRTLDEFQERLNAFSREWISFADQYKEAKMAVQTLAEFQRQLEKQHRETAELVRVETNRMQTRWDSFLQENDQRWKTAEVDTDQRWSVAARQQKQLQDKLDEIDEALGRIDQDRDAIWRVQTAQADAIKQFPRLWLEEVEKALAQNPNRRRQPALVPVREE